MRQWKKLFNTSGNQKKAGVAILISDKADLRARKIIKDKERHYIMIKRSILQEDMTNVYATNNKASNI